MYCCEQRCRLDTDLRKRYLVTSNPNMWEVSMGGSHIVTKSDGGKVVSSTHWPQCTYFTETFFSASDTHFC
jgi:hypothetical protein